MGTPKEVKCFNAHFDCSFSMATSKLSDSFKINFTLLKIFGIWPGSNVSRYYKFYLAAFLFINLFTYNSLLILNLLFTPRKIELLIKEVIFLFTEVAVTSKVFMILLMRKKIYSAFVLLDSEAFKGEGDTSKRIIESHISKYKSYWRIYAILSNFSYSSQVFLPIVVHLIFNTNMELPICKYYFLDEEIVRRYFVFWFIYQSLGIYGHMQYNVNIDTLIAGFLIMAIAQLKVLKNELKNLKENKNNNQNIILKEALQVIELNRCLKHYEQILKFCSLVQNIIEITMFVQFGMASIIICVVLCGLLLPSTVETLIFMVSYLMAMLLQIFVPAWLGTCLSYESGKLIFAAYSGEWIPRSETFKSSLKLFMIRAETEVVLRGWRMFPLSLDTFTSILKTAYSFFTLIRNVQDREKDYRNEI